MREKLLDFGYATGWAAVKALPEPAARRGFRAVADLATRRNGRGVRQLRANLRRVVGEEMGAAEFDQLVRDAMRSYARYWMETFRLPRMNATEVAAIVDVHTEGSESIDAAHAEGKGVVLALPHSGNWDVAGIWLIHHGFPFTTVNERLKPDSLFDRFVAYREGLGFELLPLTGGATPPTGVLKERLRVGQCVCLLADRDLSRNGIEVTFFGERTRMPAGPALLAATTGAALLPVHLWYFDDRTWGQWIGPPIELPEGRLADRVRVGTQALADAFEKRIAAYPADWHMLQRLWLADLPPRTGAG